MKSRSLDGLSALKISNQAYIAITLTLEVIWLSNWQFLPPQLFSTPLTPSDIKDTFLICFVQSGLFPSPSVSILNI